MTLLAIGLAGHKLITANPKNWPKQLKVLGKVDWSRENKDQWEGRAMIRGHMSKASESVALTANAIKQILGLKLTEEEQELEQRLRSS